MIIAILAEIRNEGLSKYLLAFNGRKNVHPKHRLSFEAIKSYHFVTGRIRPTPKGQQKMCGP